MRTTHPAVASYVATVREELVDLPADEIAEIAEDVREHLEQVAAEFGDDVTLGQLVERLGAPAAYAAELRSAAGLPEPTPAGTAQGTGFGRRLFRFLVSFFTVVALGLGALSLIDVVLGLSGAPAFFAVPALVAGVLAMAGAQLLVAGRDDPMAELRQLPGASLLMQVEQWMRGTPWGTPAIEFGRSLRPAWWVARAVALGLIVAYITSSASTGALVFLAALVGSVWLGRRTVDGQVEGRTRLAMQLANAGLAVGGLLVAVNVIGGFAVPRVEYVDSGYNQFEPGFYTTDGVAVTNIFAYGADGTLLENVRLYDQDGRPIDLGWVEQCYDGAYPEQTFVEANPWGEHVFPRFTVGVEPDGSCAEPVLEPPLGDLLPGAVETPAPVETPVPAPVETPVPAPVE
ncbi:HAAS signaling domain-containing protein [Jiangella gansuensis]|uniref:HAAS signaling domain-containing protein n=1 Tax=Jiangella gansuensis TaxID=281473 RepID=UPI000478F744|nr:hypothetical protein [Jiangella gansuensis]